MFAAADGGGPREVKERINMSPDPAPSSTLPQTSSSYSSFLPSPAPSPPSLGLPHPPPHATLSSSFQPSLTPHRPRQSPPPAIFMEPPSSGDWLPPKLLLILLLLLRHLHHFSGHFSVPCFALICSPGVMCCPRPLHSFPVPCPCVPAPAQPCRNRLLASLILNYSLVPSPLDRIPLVSYSHSAAALPLSPAAPPRRKSLPSSYRLTVEYSRDICMITRRHLKEGESGLLAVTKSSAPIHYLFSKDNE